MDSNRTVVPLTITEDGVNFVAELSFQVPPLVIFKKSGHYVERRDIVYEITCEMGAGGIILVDIHSGGASLVVVLASNGDDHIGYTPDNAAAGELTNFIVEWFTRGGFNTLDEYMTACAEQSARDPPPFLKEMSPHLVKMIDLRGGPVAN